MAADALVRDRKKDETFAEFATLSSVAHMPTLIRLVISLLFIAGLGLAGLYALTVFVNPGQKVITVRVPQRAMALTPVTPKPQPQVTEAAVLPSPDDSGAKEVDNSNE
jgi:hypothetical protein